MIFSVLIPVVQTDLALNLLDQIKHNTRPPDRIAIIDNSPKGIQLRKTNGSVIVFRPNPPWSFNKSLNYGRTLLPGSDLVSVLNDDLILNRHFFSVVEEGFNRGSIDMGVLCPNTYYKQEEISKVLEQQRDNPIVERLSRREGWAFTIRYSLWAQIPDVPENLVTFFGDDWLQHWTNSLGMIWGKITNHFVFHYVGASVTSTGLRSTMEDERVIFRRLLLETTETNKRRASSI